MMMILIVMVVMKRDGSVRGHDDTNEVGFNLHQGDGDHVHHNGDNNDNIDNVIMIAIGIKVKR